MEQDRFLDLVQRLPELTAEEVRQINVVLDVAELESASPRYKRNFLMLFATKTAAEKRADFRAGLNSGKILKFPWGPCAAGFDGD